MRILIRNSVIIKFRWWTVQIISIRFNNRNWNQKVRMISLCKIKI